MSRIDTLSSLNLIKDRTPIAESAEAGTTGGFAEELAKAVEGVDQQLASADQQAANALVGNGGPHEAMLSLTQAELSFRLLAQVRNKAVEAYQEIMRMTM